MATASQALTVPVSGLLVFSNKDKRLEGDRSGARLRNKAANPEICAVENELPSKKSYCSLGSRLNTRRPGAEMVRVLLSGSVTAIVPGIETGKALSLCAGFAPITTMLLSNAFCTSRVSMGSGGPVRLRFIMSTSCCIE